MTPDEKIAAWDALSKLADAQQPSAEEVLLREWKALHLSDYYLQPAAINAIQHERRLAARAAVLAELRERALAAYVDELDPRKASARYDMIADAFQRETGLWPPGRSMPLAMGAPLRSYDDVHPHWRKFCNAWHERRNDEARAALAAPSGPSVLAQVVEALREALPLVADAAANLNPPTSVVHSHVVEALRALAALKEKP